MLRVYEPVRAADATVLPMVFAAGGDLRQMRGAPYTKILPLLIDIAAALEHAHSRRIVHRDLKPSNILLDGAGRPLLADFGAGASEGDNSSGPPGSPFSASPQQLAGEPARPTDDIYGLGALAYELLSGYPPFYPGVRREEDRHRTGAAAQAGQADTAAARTAGVLVVGQAGPRASAVDAARRR